MNDTETIAVNVQNVVFGYNKKSAVLDNISVSVPKGKIYALLGSSGCGKTTLLRLILGQLKPKRGSVTVFDTEPGSRFSDIPGSGVGYMPQQRALYLEFTVEETLVYFSKLYNISEQALNKTTEFLTQLLNLPDKYLRIKCLSGGQQRMVSFAATLLHCPPLLILDEPTVGVDPIYRFQIWKYLEDICVNDGKTVIITTHYIEEAKTASIVAFMSYGIILTESNPKDLLDKYNLSNLEDVFLRFLETDSHLIKCQLLNDSLLSKDNVPRNSQKVRKQINLPEKKFRNHKKLGALFLKNYLNIKRNPMLMFFFLILPVIQITLFCASVGKPPHNLPIAIITDSMNNNRTDLSAQYLETLDHKLMRQQNYDSFDKAIVAVKRGKAWVAIHMSENFTHALEKFAKNPDILTDQDYENAKIKIYADFSNTVITRYVHRSLLMSYADIFLPSLGPKFESVRSPLEINEPIYGVNEWSVEEFVAPGAIMAIIFSTPLIMASFLLVVERNDGLLERSYIAGTKAFEVLSMHLITMMIALVFQVILLMFVSFVIFKVVIRGSIIQVFGLIYLTGLQGITFGLLVSALSATEVQAFIAFTALILPVWMVCGVFWPLEGTPAFLKEIIIYAPLSLPLQSMRFMVSRGWTIFYPSVFMGFVVNLVYNIVLFTAAAIVFHFNFP